MGHLQIQEVEEKGPERVKAEGWPKNVGAQSYVSRRIMTCVEKHGLLVTQRRCDEMLSLL